MIEDNGKKILREMREMVLLRNKPINKIHPFQIGIDLFVNEEFERAIIAFQDAILLKPDFAFSHYYLGRCWRRIGKYEEAINAFNQSIQLNPLHAPSYAYIGDIYLSENKLAEAEKFFRQAIDFQFDNLIALSGLVKLAKINGDWYGCDELLKNAYFKGSNNPIFLMELLSLQQFESPFYLQIADELKNQKYFYRAIFFYRLALLKNPENKKIQAKIEEVFKFL